ncbi:hypothetical protein HED96_005104, partial [Salmonella enterica]|nr:hypothetical protein [Salmonella enterica]
MKPLNAFRRATIGVCLGVWVTGTCAKGGAALGGSYSDDGVAVGTDAYADDSSVAVGVDASSYIGGVAIGVGAKARQIESVAVGGRAKSGEYARNTVLGYAATIGDGARDSVAIGTDSTSNRSYDVSIGTTTLTRTLSNLSAGTEDNDAVNKKQLDDVDKAAKGYAATAENRAVAAAWNMTQPEIKKVLESGSAAGDGNFAIGKNANVNGIADTAIGQGATGNGGYSTAIGAGSRAAGLNSIATGVEAKATGSDSVAIGNSAKANGKNSMALGAASVADHDNQVSIGQKITDAASGAVSYITRTLSNLTDGTDAHDAVNKGQLDTAKASAISEANKHTDDEIGKLDTRAQGYATTAQTTANKHTDDEIGKLDTKAQGYATTAQSAANKYTDDTVSKVNEKVLKDANTYTDDTAKTTLKTANEHTERRAVIAENNAVTRSNA